MLVVQTALLSVLFAADGPAQKQTLGVFALSGNAPKELRLQTERAVQTGIVEPTLRVALEGAPIADATVVFGCSVNDPGCIRSIAKALKADLLLHGSVQSKDGTRFELSLTLARSDGRVLATGETSFLRRTLRERVELVARDLVARGLGKPAAVGKITVRSTPVGASVFQSGELAGKTPVEFELSIGRHLIEVKLGKRVEHREVDIVLGTQTLDVTFPPILREPPKLVTVAPSEGRSWVGPSVGLGIGAVAAGVGAAFLVLAQGKQTELDDGVAALPSPPTSSDRARLGELDDIASAGQRNAVIGYVAVGAGAATVAVSLIWGLLGSNSNEGATLEPGASGAVVRW